MGPGLNPIFFFGKSSKNSSKPVLIFWSSIQCVFCLYTLLKVISYYECSVHVSDGFPKKVWMGVGGWGELYPSLFWIFRIFLTLQSPLVYLYRHRHTIALAALCICTLTNYATIQDVYQKTLQTHYWTDMDVEKESWTSEQAQPDDDQCIFSPECC